MSDTTIGASSLVKPSAEDTKAVDKESKKAELDEEKAIGGKKEKNFLKKAGQKLAQPFVDEFHKDYGEDAVATPKTVGDFVLDHAIKIGVAALTIGVTFAAARGKFNGFSKNFAKNIKSEKPLTAVKNAFDTVKTKNAQALLDAKAIKDGAKNIDDLAEAVDTIASGAGKGAGKKGIAAKIGEIIKAEPKEKFAEGSKLPKIIDKVFGKKADKVKDAALKMGIGEGSDVADLALAAGATTTAATGTGIITDEAVNKNDESLSIQSKIDAITKGMEVLEKITG